MTKHERIATDTRRKAIKAARNEKRARLKKPVRGQARRNRRIGLAPKHIRDRT